MIEFIPFDGNPLSAIGDYAVFDLALLLPWYRLIFKSYGLYQS